MDISLKRTYDTELIKAVLGLPEIWDRFSEGVEFNDYTPNMVDSMWLLIYMGELEIIGIILTKMDTSCAISFHPYLRKEKRKHARQMMLEFYKFFNKHIPKQINKIHATIPTCFQSAINCAKKMGFKVEGVSKESYLRNEKLYDRVYLGVTRAESIL